MAGVSTDYRIDSGSGQCVGTIGKSLESQNSRSVGGGIGEILL